MCFPLNADTRAGPREAACEAGSSWVAIFPLLSLFSEILHLAVRIKVSSLGFQVSFWNRVAAPYPN